MDVSKVFLVLATLCAVVAETSGLPEILKASACYGTTNNFVELMCKPGDVITVTQVLYGAKLKSDNCPVPTVNMDHPPSCCYLTDTDCAFSLPMGSAAVPDPYMKLCAGKETCSMRTTWLDTTGRCSDQYMSHTNFMELTYYCTAVNSTRPNNVAASPSSTTTPSTTSATTSTTTATTTTTTATTTTTTTTTTTQLSTSQLLTKAKTDTKTTDDTISFTKDTPEQDKRKTIAGPDLPHPRSHTTTGSTGAPSLPSSSSPSPGRHIEVDVSFTTTSRPPGTGAETSSFAFTTGMMGGMTAAIVGLMLTIFGFLFYWGRRKRKLTTMKPNNSTVWDFLLAHTVAARTFRRGYDNFSNNRESVGSEGDVPQGKQTWLPNIRVEPGLDTLSVTSDENCSIVNINTLDNNNGTVSSRNDRSEV